MNLARIIESAEEKYRQILEEYFINTWGDTALFSHDIEHHRRVWHYAKELINGTGTDGKYRIAFSPEELLVACYLHDLGMSVETGERHGSHSSNFCREFIFINKLSESEFSGVLDAIADHDDKDYLSFDNSLNLNTFLTTADDLDAFGYIGILRYLEIYLIRGVSLRKIGYKIRENAARRYGNFKSVFGQFPGLLERHSQRFFLLDDFFSSYNREIEKLSFSNKYLSGDAYVVELISELIRDHITSINMIADSEILSEDPAAINFARQLRSELNAFNNL